MIDAPRVRPCDVAGAAVVAGALVIVMARIDGGTDLRPFDLLAGLLVAKAGVVLALHRRAPLLVLTLVTAALALYGLRDYSGGPVYLTWIVAIFALSVARGPVKAAGPALVSMAVICFTAFAGSTAIGGALSPRLVVAALFISWAVGGLLVGGSVRSRRAERASLEDRARRLAETREEEARRRVAEERVRIARDLHDSVAHTLASFAVQAGVGAHVLDERPEDARAALLAIKHASVDALAELRATLGMLRSGEAAPREPTAGLDRLPSVVESSRAAGHPVDVVIEGEARPLPPAVDTAAFRIVQESLTNVIRHAGPARATVAVRHHDSCVDIEVTDDGRGAGDGDGGGHGLAGMRERVALLGGELHAGTRASGGYRVRAWFRCDPRRARGRSSAHSQWLPSVARHRARHRSRRCHLQRT